MWPGVGAAESECGQGWVRPSLSVARRCAAKSECGQGVRPSLSVAGGGAESECGRGGAAESRVWPGSKFWWRGWSWMCVGGECHTGYIYMVHGCRNNNNGQTTQSITKNGYTYTKT